jgi:hypothetical protein
MNSLSIYVQCSKSSAPVDSALALTKVEEEVMGQLLLQFMEPGERNAAVLETNLWGEYVKVYANEPSGLFELPGCWGIRGL